MCGISGIISTNKNLMPKLLMAERVQLHSRTSYIHISCLNQMGVSAKKVTLIYYAQSAVLASLCVFYVYSCIPMRMVTLAFIITVYTVYFFRVHKAARARGLI